MPLLELAGLTAGYGHRRVLHDINLDVDDGEIVAILGANGAGKTTTLRAISGAIQRAGTVGLLGPVAAQLRRSGHRAPGHCARARRVAARWAS